MTNEKGSYITGAGEVRNYRKIILTLLIGLQ